MGKAKLVRQSPDLDVYKAQKKEELNQKTNEAIVKGFQATTVIASTGKAHFYACEDHDQRNFMGAFIVLGSDPTRTTFPWKTEDTGVFISHTRNEILQICIEVFNHINSHIGIGVGKKEAIDQAQRVEDIDDIIAAP